MQFTYNDYFCHLIIVFYGNKRIIYVLIRSKQ